MMHKIATTGLIILIASIFGGCEMKSSREKTVQVGQVTSMIQARGQLAGGERKFSSDKQDITLAIVSDTPEPGQGYVNLQPTDAAETQPVTEEEMAEVLQNGNKPERKMLATSSYIKDENTPAASSTTPQATPTKAKKPIPAYEPDFLIVHPDLRIDTQVSHSRLFRGEPVIFTITVTNKSNKPLKDVDVSLKTSDQLCYLRHRTSWNIRRWNRQINLSKKPDQDLYTIPGKLKPGESITFDTTYALKP